jgi:hypothetical protein
MVAASLVAGAGGARCLPAMDVPEGAQVSVEWEGGRYG